MRRTVSPTQTPSERSNGTSAPFRGELRVRLLAVVALALSPLLALSVVQAVLQYSEDRVVRRDRLYATAQRAADRVDTVVQGARPLLESMRLQEPIRSGGETCSQILSSALFGMAAYNNIKRVDRDGIASCSAVPVETPADETERGGGWFEELRAGAPFAVSEVFYSRVSRGQVVMAAIPLVTLEGAFDGALALSIDVTTLGRFVDTDLLPPSASAALLDASGGVISRFEGFPYAQIPLELLERARAQPQGVLLSGDERYPGRDVLIAPIVDGHMFIALTTPNPSLATWASVDLIGTVLLPLFMWLIALAAVALASERLVLQWLAYLGRIARVYGAGRLDFEPTRAATAPAEIAELATAMSSMASSLKAREVDLQETADKNAALVMEVHHRVKNNLQIIISLFNLQISSAQDPATIAALEEARARVNALALVHRSLYEADEARFVQLDVFLNELLSQIQGAARFGPGQVELEAAIEPADMAPDEAVPLALFVTEAVTNALKHGFVNRDTGRLRVTLARSGDRLRLDIEDDGVGWGDDSDGAGVGVALMEGFARQLGAKMEAGPSSLGGARVSLEFGARAA